MLVPAVVKGQMCLFTNVFIYNGNLAFFDDLIPVDNRKECGSLMTWKLAYKLLHLSR